MTVNVQHTDLYVKAAGSKRSLGTSHSIHTGDRISCIAITSIGYKAVCFITSA